MNKAATPSKPHWCQFSTWITCWPSLPGYNRLNKVR
jgi:hypothetical protein